MKIIERLIAAYARVVLAYPGALLLLLTVLTGLSVWAASLLTINTNQLDLISQDLQAVKDVKRVVDMVGGAGHLIIGVRGSDEATIKGVADDINDMLVADKAHIRHVTYKLSTEFIRQKAPMFVDTKDLEEVRRQGMLKIKDAIRRASPFFVEIKETKPYEHTLDPIIDKYKKVGKKSIADDYYISEDKQMVLLVVKPMWDGNELGKTGELVEDLRQKLAAYSKNNKRGVQLAEEYDREPHKEKSKVGFGFTGSYKTSYDDSFEMKESLVPTSTISFFGVLAVLLAFLGRRLGAVLLMTGGMMAGLAITFGFTYLAVGQLNMITSILGGILMGQGIDFGIHLVYRIRYYLGQGEEWDSAVQLAVQNAGLAALVSATASAGSFFALLFSEFRGFSQFGLLAGVGTYLIGTAIFVAVPAVLVLLGRHWPKVPAMICGLQPPDRPRDGHERRIPWPRVLLGVTGTAVLVLTWFAPSVHFEYNTRALMVEQQPSVRLQDEVAARFQMSADPVAIYTKDLADAKKVHAELYPLDRKKYSTVDQVLSIYTFVPPADQQARNAKVLADWKTDLADIDLESVPPEHQEKYKMLLGYLDTKPYDLAGLPGLYREQFTHLPTTKAENHGWLTFVYPVVDLWDGKQMLKFADEIEEIHTKDGSTFRAAGLPILFAHLAKIVLFDGKMSMILTGLLLLVLLYFDFRSLRSALVALLPLVAGMGTMLGVMALAGWSMNFMNIVVFPIVFGVGISHGVYLMHRFNEGTSPFEALRTVGLPVAASTITTLAGWAGLLWAGHKGLKSMGILACVGMTATLLVSFTVMPAMLQIFHDRRQKAKAGQPAAVEAK